MDFVHGVHNQMPKMPGKGFQSLRKDGQRKTAVHLSGLQPAVCGGFRENARRNIPSVLPHLRQKDARLPKGRRFYKIQVFRLPRMQGFCKGPKALNPVSIMA